MKLKEYKDTVIYIIIMLIIFIISFIFSPYRNTNLWMALIYSGGYGFIVGSSLYFGFQYGHKKMRKK